MNLPRREFKSFLIGALLAAMLAMWLSPGGESDWLYEIYDELRPVATGKMHDIQQQENEVLFDLTVTKHRPCTYIAATAYAVGPSIREQMFLHRLDRPTTGVTHPVGVEFKAGRWRAWPVYGATRIEYWITYRCSARTVLAHIATAQLEAKP